jgi:CheY-like chemotaxis protein
MGGSIELKSQPEKGSTFSLLIPQQRAIFVAPVIASKEPAVLTNDLASHYPMSILAVDDNDLNLRLIIAMLQRLGYSPFSARNGLEAVEIYQKEHPQCILMDIQMPVLNGIDATKQIREIETASARPRAYISALTANRVPEDQAHCIGAGMNFCLTKPVKIQNIADVVIAASAIAVGAV